MRPSVPPRGQSSLKSVLRIFFSARGANPWVVLCCLIAASLCEGFGFATLVPVLGAATGSDNQSLVSESVRGVLHTLGLDASLGTLIIVLIAGLLLSSVISLYAMRKVGYANAEVANLMRVRLIKQMLGARWSYLLEHPTGRIANAFSGEVSRSQQAYQLAAQFVAEGIQTRQQMIFGNQNWSSTVVGTNIDFLQVKSWPMKSGTFFSDQDVKAAAKVVALGTNVAEMLFGDADPVGETIRIKNQPFKVVGVMASKGSSSSGQNQDDQVFVPWTTVTKKLQRSDNLQYIITSTVSAEEVGEAQKQITAALRTNHKLTGNDPDDFRAQTQEDMLAMRSETTQTMTSLLASVAAVSLMVGLPQRDRIGHAG